MITDYSELDANIVALVRELNQWPHIKTLGSCGGHAEPTNACQFPAGSYYVKFRLLRRPGMRYVLEHLAWAINHDYAQVHHGVRFFPDAPPPYLNKPGYGTLWLIEGYDEDPNDLAAMLPKYRELMTPKAWEGA